MKNIKLSAALLIGLMSIGFASQAQHAKMQKPTPPPANWFNLDLATDSAFGVSTEKTYKELLLNKTAKTIIVAVIDGGTDVNHEDLKDIIWTNPKEIAGNGIDDDHNGYVDDIHGWNFIGGKNGDVNEDTYEYTRLYGKYSAMFSKLDTLKLDKEQKKDFLLFREARKEQNASIASAKYLIERYTKISAAVDKIVKSVGRDSMSLDDLKGFKYSDKWDSLALLNMRTLIQAGPGVPYLEKTLKNAIENTKKNLDTRLNPDFNPRTIVGDNYEDATERYYGNNDVTGPNPTHGTHVAGIIGAVRNNDLGIKGIADHIRIMVVRVVPDGDERDKDVANGIRYAVDNGASVINMSFGKSFSFNKKAVDDAIKYAQSKDVLIVHAAGNEAKNIDRENHFPNACGDGKKPVVDNWIEVGASSFKDNESLTAVFSNFGKKRVDLFAPGVNLKSTVGDNKYESLSGTSMASPVVAGVAAVIRSYFPTLTAAQVREILMESTTPVKHKVYEPDNHKTVKLSKISRTGGVVNLYNAVQLAEKTKDKKTEGTVSQQ